MIDPNTEHKEATVDETMDKFFENRDSTTSGEEQPQENAQPENEQTETKEAESDSDKTESTETSDSFKDVDKGFANHPAWQKRETKLKEAEAKIKELEGSSSIYARLLDDPLIYKKYLETQGFSKESISRVMAEKGFQVEAQKAPTAPSGQDIAENICKKLNWDIGRLNQDQKNYITDQISLIQAVAEDIFGKTLDARLKPMEGYLRQVESEKTIDSDLQSAMAKAKEEFPDLDWEKEILPAMDKWLEELDKKDPRKTIKIDAETLYEKATRQLLKEKQIAGARQEERNGLKKNARPLMPRFPNQKSPNSFKGGTARETADKFLDSIGLKD